MCSQGIWPCSQVTTRSDSSREQCSAKITTYVSQFGNCGALASGSRSVIPKRALMVRSQRYRSSSSGSSSPGGGAVTTMGQ